MLKLEDLNRETPSVFIWKEMWSCSFSKGVLPWKYPSLWNLSLYNLPSVISLRYLSSLFSTDDLQSFMCWIRVPSERPASMNNSGNFFNPCSAARTYMCALQSVRYHAGRTYMCVSMKNRRSHFVWMIFFYIALIFR